MDDHQARSLTNADNSDYLPKSLLAYALTMTLTFLLSLGAKTLAVPIHAQENPPVAAPAVLSASIVPSPTVTPEPTEEPIVGNPNELVTERESIHRYITTIFGPNAKTAVAIADAESGAMDKTGQRYFKTWAVHSSDVELSVGLFQINLKSKTTLVHYNRIPGTTQEEKVEWLKNPYNNTLFAYWIFSTSTFAPWSTYTDGSYLAYAK